MVFSFFTSQLVILSRRQSFLVYKFVTFRDFFCLMLRSLSDIYDSAYIDNFFSFLI